MQQPLRSPPTLDDELAALAGASLSLGEEPQEPPTLDEELETPATREEVIQSAAEWPDQNNPAASL